MHEASLTQGLLNIILKSLAEYREANPVKGELVVTRITCEAGLLACFEFATLSACLEVFSEGTPCEKAELFIETAPLECCCKNCGKNFSLVTRDFQCPVCNSTNITFQGGNGLILKSLEVEEAKNG